MIAENLRKIRAEIVECAQNCGRDPSSIQLIAVSKTFGAGPVREAFSAGAHDFGENFAQELRDKQAQLTDLPIRWHFIGHLQTNKVKYVVPVAAMIHSVDSLRLAQEIDRRGAHLGRTIEILIEVHTTDEATKFGVPPDQLLPLVRQLGQLPRVRVQGLMTMGPFSEDAESSRSCFRTVRELAREVTSEGLSGVEMNHLSMGMTHDFRIAIEEGATLVRIGTAVFGKRDYDQ